MLKFYLHNVAIPTSIAMRARSEQRYNGTARLGEEVFIIQYKYLIYPVILFSVKTFSSWRQYA
jgi:hypothetical protein